MKILLIDNETTYLPRLEKLLADHTIKKVGWTDSLDGVTRGMDCVVLSGGHGLSVERNPVEFGPEMKLARDCDIPLLGICLGCQVLAAAYGGRLSRLNHKAKGMTRISVVKDDPLLMGLGNFSVFDNHRWVINSAPSPLQVLAVSSIGIEVIRHQRKLVYGVQFHPEVAPDLTPGRAIVQTFLRLASSTSASH